MKINVGGGCDKFGRRRRAGWREKIRWALLDLSGAYRAAYQRALPQAVQIADPFHVVRLANLCLDRVRRRVQEETLRHRGRKHDDLYRIRKPAHPRPRTTRPPAANKNWAASSKRETPAGRYATLGTLKKPYGGSTKPAIQAKATNTPVCLPRNSKTNPAHPNSTNSDEPSPPGIPRSWLGITPAWATDPPNQPTTSSNA